MKKVMLSVLAIVFAATSVLANGGVPVKTAKAKKADCIKKDCPKEQKCAKKPCTKKACC